MHGHDRTSSRIRARKLPVAVLGGEGARLLAGPEVDPESFVDHELRLGRLQVSNDPYVLVEQVRASGLVGRGGGEFPLIAKLDLARASQGIPIVVVNASEGEPASRKDRTLVEFRPHLVLDGAQIVAHAIGAEEVVVYVHGRGTDLAMVLSRAVTQRFKHGHDHVPTRILETPERYVAGEASAVVNAVAGGQPLPKRSEYPPAAVGIHGRPTIVSNVETYAHVALIARFGPDWFREAGSVAVPGSTLVTLAGSLSSRGTVLEILGPISLEELLVEIGGGSHFQAVLLGGYSGTWLNSTMARPLKVERAALRGAGAALGCGLIVPLGSDACGIAETARLLRWMAGESAGQCGPCVNGLPAIARVMGELASGSGHRSDIRRLRQLAVMVRGRGACGHPTGVANLLESTMEVFAEELEAHARGKRCLATGEGLPLPSIAPEGAR